MATNGIRKQYALGIDLGTTNVKVAVLDLTTKNVIRSKSRETQAFIHSDLGSLGNEQDPQRIMTALQFCVSGLPKEDLVRVKKIGISGQMHGVLLWKKGQGWNQNSYGRFEVGKVSNLITWQDGRCSSDFLANLPKPKAHLRLASGFGCATLFWLLQNKKECLDDFDCAGTIQDMVVSMLCGLSEPLMSVHNAASWGYFDTVSKTWNKDM